MKTSTGMDMPLFPLWLFFFPLRLRQASEYEEGTMKKQVWRIHSIFCQPGP